jgi:hypothetical protein
MDQKTTEMTIWACCTRQKTFITFFFNDSLCSAIGTTSVRLGGKVAWR